MEYIGRMDPECVPLCDAINKLPDLETVESCCGHGKHPFRVWVHTEDMEALPPMLYYLDSCHIGYTGWRAEIYTDCAMSFPSIMIEGPTGEEAYEQANYIAEKITEWAESHET